jgi:predicted transcriptional regulator of viral defense system
VPKAWSLTSRHEIQLTTSADVLVAWLAAGQRGVVTIGDLLACGPAAVLSHYSPAALHELVHWDGRPFDVTAPTKRTHPRINAHRAKTIERIVVKGMPVTPKLRTVIDLSKTADEKTVKSCASRARRCDGHTKSSRGCARQGSQIRNGRRRDALGRTRRMARIVPLMRPHVRRS